MSYRGSAGRLCPVAAGLLAIDTHQQCLLVGLLEKPTLEDQRLLNMLLSEVDQSRLQRDLCLSLDAYLFEPSLDPVVGDVAYIIERARLQVSDERDVGCMPISYADFDSRNPGRADQSIPMFREIYVNICSSSLHFSSNPRPQPSNVTDACLLDFGCIHGKVPFNLNLDAALGQGVERKLGWLEVGGLRGILLNALRSNESKYDENDYNAQNDKCKDAGPSLPPGKPLAA